MANVPLSGTNLRLLSGVPFQNDYKNSRWFTSKASQLAYFTSKPVIHQESQKSFQQIEGKHYVSVNRHIDDLWNVNYLMFQNAQYNNKWFYAFVTKLEYRQGNNTRLYFEVDVLQTWKFDMQFKPSYVSREHRKLWNSDGSPVINTIDEGLDYGTEYETVSVDSWLPFDDIYFLVIVSKSAVHKVGLTGTSYNNQVLATNNGMQQPLTYYIHPFRMESGKFVQPLVSVDGGAYFGVSQPLEIIQRLSEMTVTVNNIVSMYVTDFTGLNITKNSEGNLAFDGSVEHATIEDNTYSVSTLCVKDVLNYSQKTKSFGDKYSGYHSVTESKLLMYPYTTLTLDDFKGNRLDLKNEFIDSRNLSITVKGSMGTSNHVTYAIPNYLNDKLSTTKRNQVSLEYALINSSPNDIPVVTDMLSAFLQGNRNSIQNRISMINHQTTTGMISNTVSGVGSAISKNPLGLASSTVGLFSGAKQGVLELEGLLAKKKDIENTPPMLNKMGSNTAYDYGNNYHGVYVIKKQIRSEYRKILSDFFNMYGYKTNEVKIPNFRTRKNWNYVQTEGCNILGNINNNDLTELKAVFDNGITLWHTDDIGNYSLENGVRS